VIYPRMLCVFVVKNNFLPSQEVVLMSTRFAVMRLRSSLIANSTRDVDWSKFYGPAH